MTVRLSEVIAILDLERTENAPATREYLQMARVEKRLGEIGGEVKALVVTAGAIYPSPISSVTLARRAAESQRRSPLTVAREVF